MNRGTPLMAVGLALIAAALCLTGYNLAEESAAERNADRVVTQMREILPEASGTAEEDNRAETPPSDPGPLYQSYPEVEMPAVEVEGELYIGILQIPALQLELPVMREWSYPKLKTAPCRFTGSAYTDDLVLMAHNYERHFGRLKDLGVGDAVRFTDMDQNVFSYRVEAVELLQAEDVENMTAGEWPLTLFTCTVGGAYRVTVRCERIANEWD